MLSFVLLFSTLSQSIVATTVYAGNILMMEQDSELPVKEDQADITDQDHQEKNTDTENTNSNDNRLSRITKAYWRTGRKYGCTIQRSVPSTYPVIKQTRTEATQTDRI